MVLSFVGQSLASGEETSLWPSGSGSGCEMSDSFRALCSDFYINQKLPVKMDLPRPRHGSGSLSACGSSFSRCRSSAATGKSWRWNPAGRGAAPLARRAQQQHPLGRRELGQPGEEYSLHKTFLETAPFFGEHQPPGC